MDFKRILAIQPEKSDDIIKLKIDEFPQDLKLVGPTKEAADLDNELLISLSQLGDWLILIPNISGDYTFKLQVVSSEIVVAGVQYLKQCRCNYKLIQLQTSDNAVK